MVVNTVNDVVKRIKESIAAGDYKGAEETINRLPEELITNKKVLTLRAIVSYRIKDLNLAITTLASLEAMEGLNFRLNIIYAKSLSECKEFEEAINRLNTIKIDTPEQQITVNLLLAGMEFERGNNSLVPDIEYWASVPLTIWQSIRITRLYLSLSQEACAIRVAKKSFYANSDEVKLANVYVDALSSSGDIFNRDEIARLRDMFPDNYILATKYVQFLRNCAELKLSRDAADDLLEVFKDKPQVIRQCLKLFPDLIQKHGIDSVASGSEDVFDDKRFEMLYRGDGFSSAVEYLQKDFEYSYSLEVYRKLFSTINGKSDAIREPASMPVFNNIDEVLVFPREGSKKTILLFSGFADQIHMPLPFQHILLSSLNVNLVYFRDSQRLLYMNGISQLGDNLEKTFDRIREQLVELGTEDLYCIGSSGGGLGALYYGCKLGAKAVIGYSAPTSMKDNIISKDPRGKSVVRRYRKLLPEMDVDINEFSGNYDAPVCTLYYGENNATDKLHAENARLLKNVQLKPLENYSDHNVVVELCRRGTYLSDLELLLA